MTSSRVGRPATGSIQDVTLADGTTAFQLRERAPLPAVVATRVNALDRKAAAIIAEHLRDPQRPWLRVHRWAGNRD